MRCIGALLPRRFRFAFRLCDYFLFTNRRLEDCTGKIATPDYVATGLQKRAEQIRSVES